MMEYYVFSAELTAKIVLDDLGLEPFKPTEKESKLLQITKPERYWL